MRSIILLIVALVVVCLIPEIAATTATTEPTTKQENNQTALPSLFDFARYQKIFNKHYGSLVETLTRRAYFIPRALRVLSSAMAYRFGQKDYHLSLNQMSDFTGVEVDRMRNHRVDFYEEKKSNGHSNINSSLIDESETIQVSDKEIKVELEKLVKVEPEVEEILVEMAPISRKRRSIGSVDESQKTEKMQRSLHLNDLISSGSSDDEGVPTTGRSFEDLNENDLQIMATIQPQFDVQFSELSLGVPLREQTLNNAQIKQQKAYLREQIKEKQASELKITTSIASGQSNRRSFGDDLALVDHSRDACMDEPRYQGECGSCWAFASIAMYEWLYCKSTRERKLVRFSEQYLVDCTHKFYKMGDCIGGHEFYASKFVRNFGLELRSTYPYQEQVTTCPLMSGGGGGGGDEEEEQLKTAGYVRVESDNGFVIPQSLWEEYLHYGPLLVALHDAGSDFMEYGRGVHELRQCSKQTLHAMLLVGYGVQNGKKYWKLRNSYGKQWGERGYYRVSQYSGDCLRNYASALATIDAQHFHYDKIKRNYNHKPPNKRNGLAHLSQSRLILVG